ncbi:uncharacterized protein LOC116339188 [Contarinia nasturtii]|uniref:uncharacterized protein LOC116339188 n=1 Tax=Contarinia nasturtii TaxID=265458 RepID=UPI0012D40FD8|nr:uncharacterized protein LOC116339188 [Contarinia nasturtii]
MKTAVTLLAFSIIGFNYVNACDKTSCTPTPAHYDELGCEPVLDDDEMCCPKRYECPERSENGGCNYRGKLYKVGESISEQFLPKRCDAECTCEHWNDDNTYKFVCRGIPKSDINDYEIENKLVRVLDKYITEETHDPIERCAGFPVTDADELATLKKTKCTFEGVVYKKGDKIQPDGTCYECICDERIKSHDLDIYSPQCQRKQCGLGVSGEEHDYLNRGCAPVYDKTATICCPIEWRCPTPTDVIKKSGIPLSSDRKMKCQFGEKSLNLLDQVLYEDGDKLNCKCYIPPMVHCLKNAVV